MDEGRRSNWYSRNYNNRNEESNHNEKIENIKFPRSTHIRRRHRGIALIATVVSYVFLSREFRMSIQNNILPSWMKVEEYLHGHPRRMFNKVRMTPRVFTTLCMCLKERDLVVDSRGLRVEEQLFIFLMIVSQSQNS